MRKLVVFALLAVADAQGASAQLDSTGPRRLPKPTGQYKIANQRFVWTDSTRPEIGDEGPRPERRAIAVRIWYPTSATGQASGPYVPFLEAYQAAGSIGPRTAGLLRSVVGSSLREGPVAPAAGRLPVILFSPGNGEMEFMYTALAEELASHGYGFVLLMHPGVSDVALEGGRVLRRYARLFDPKPTGWEASLPTTMPANLKRALYDTMYTEAASYLTADVAFAIDQLARLNAPGSGQFAGHLDLNRMAATGHSYGGNIAVEACYRLILIKACAQFDGGAFGPVRDSGLTKPYMLIRPALINDGFPRGVAQNQIIGSLKSDGFEVNIEGAVHRSFMDAHIISPAGRGEAMPPERVLQISSAYLRAFLDAYLEGKPSGLLATSPSPYREVYLRVLRSDSRLRR